MKARFVSLGCKVNQYETQALKCLFAEAGYTETESNDADVAVINSCTVTSLADRKTRQVLRKLRREMPDCVIALTGCMPQASNESADLAEADIVTGTRDRQKLLSLIDDFVKTQKRRISLDAFSQNEPFEYLSPARFDDGFQRAYLKIEDGCDRFCAYCIIPYARGRVRSRSPQSIYDETEKLVKAGYREIVLTGINISRYGSDIGLSLCDAVEAAAKVEGDFRIRLGSVEPDLITESDWHRLAAVKKLCPHFHLPIQSACDNTLKAMNRRYTMAEFFAVVSLIRSLFDNPAISADIIVGFPGESDSDFNDTCRNIASLGLLRAHIFEYSPRKGTPAADMKNQIPPPVKKDRAKTLSAICEDSAKEYARSQKGKTARVLIEATGSGYADNYLYVKLPPNCGKTGDFINVVLTDEDNGVCIGEPIKL
ncbi:MAG: tRNA (N(6)-L-threonylcarbamoyladenosine(37)-C(2))-methylthiotransferase MtaB [Oscillospiraceae bacterium]|nr:tRNA (N(6)-L-threonylcarbamoyladenosine(37)-C(2))-methylthiotransferase MtaB [Oscillospiraceae bacterium]